MQCPVYLSIDSFPPPPFFCCCCCCCCCCKKVLRILHITAVSILLIFTFLCPTISLCICVVTLKPCLLSVSVYDKSRESRQQECRAPTRACHRPATAPTPQPATCRLNNLLGQRSPWHQSPSDLQGGHRSPQRHLSPNLQGGHRSPLRHLPTGLQMGQRSTTRQQRLQPLPQQQRTTRTHPQVPRQGERDDR